MHTGFVGCGYIVWFGQYTEIAFLVSLFGFTTPAYTHLGLGLPCFEERCRGGFRRFSLRLLSFGSHQRPCPLRFLTCQPPLLQNAFGCFAVLLCHCRCLAVVVLNGMGGPPVVCCVVCCSFVCLLLEYSSRVGYQETSQYE